MLKWLSLLLLITYNKSVSFCIISHHNSAQRSIIKIWELRFHLIEKQAPVGSWGGEKRNRKTAYKNACWMIAKMMVNGFNCFSGVHSVSQEFYYIVLWRVGIGFLHVWIIFTTQPWKDASRKYVHNYFSVFVLCNSQLPFGVQPSFDFVYWALAAWSNAIIYSLNNLYPLVFDRSLLKCESRSWMRMRIYDRR